MLGPDTADEFGRFSHYEPPVLRSQLADFGFDDAKLVLDGVVTPEKSRHIAQRVRDALRQGKMYTVLEHGGHRYGTGWGKSEFAPGWREPEVIAFARAIVDNPTNIVQRVHGFTLHGTYQGIPGVVVVNHDGTGKRGWHAVTVHPTGLP